MFPRKKLDGTLYRLCIDVVFDGLTYINAVLYASATTIPASRLLAITLLNQVNMSPDQETERR